MIESFFVRSVLIAGLIASQAALAPDCVCGPDFCLNDSRYPPKITAKKKQMSDKGYPKELIALLDRDGACVAAIDRAPDGFSLKLLKSDGSSSTIVWTPDDDNLAQRELKNGTLKAYYKFNVSRAFSCCGEPKYDQRSDWDPSLELNLKLAVACTMNGGSVGCKPGQ
jgi:hypothetical protein